MFPVQPHMPAGRARVPSDFDIGYAMGLIVGEGSFTGDRRAACLSVRLHADDPLPLEHLWSLFGGRIYGPYEYGIRRSWAWMLRGDDLWDALPMLFDRLPPSRKRRQLEAWAVRYGFTSRKPGRLFGVKDIGSA